MIKAVIFDMDGVLIDSEPYYLQRRLDFFASVAITVAKSQLQQVVGGNMKVVLPLLLPGKTAPEYAALLQSYRAYKASHPLNFTAALQPGAREILQELQQQGYQLALASSSDRQFIQEMLTKTQLTDVFSVVLSGQDFAKSKPDPSIYLTSLNQLGVTAKEALAIEDSQMGIASAKAAGIYTLAFAVTNPLVATDQSAADAKIEKFDQVLTYL
ncbi:HAD family hydrolase [Lapidilactobacillus wuchangensis]|uniref:HAD family hydrolase n=1 Tax=Lapidilactobacillus wuchangensis TaxID=2486001 RepID=UPI000F7ACC22|nr:HAD family phosphatase [Lapidilactobacillus wuchangensis]